MIKRKISIGKPLREIAIDYAKEKKLNPDLVEQLYKVYWENINKKASSLDHWSIRVENFATLTTSPNKCKKYLRYLEWCKAKYETPGLQEQIDKITIIYNKILNRYIKIQELTHKKRLEKKNEKIKENL